MVFLDSETLEPTKDCADMLKKIGTLEWGGGKREAEIRKFYLRFGTWFPAGTKMKTFLHTCISVLWSTSYLRGKARSSSGTAANDLQATCSRLLYDLAVAWQAQNLRNTFLKARQTKGQPSLRSLPALVFRAHMCLAQFNITTRRVMIAKQLVIPWTGQSPWHGML